MQKEARDSGGEDRVAPVQVPAHPSPLKHIERADVRAGIEISAIDARLRVEGVVQRLVDEAGRTRLREDVHAGRQ